MSAVMLFAVRNLPKGNYGLDEQGLNSAWDEVVLHEDPKLPEVVLELLGNATATRLLLRRLFSLNSEQRRLLDAMSDDDLIDYVSPLRNALAETVGEVPVILWTGGQGCHH